MTQSVNLWTAHHIYDTVIGFQLEQLFERKGKSDNIKEEQPQ